EETEQARGPTNQLHHGRSSEVSRLVHPGDWGTRTARPPPLAWMMPWAMGRSLSLTIAEPSRRSTRNCPLTPSLPLGERGARRPPHPLPLFPKGRGGRIGRPLFT